MLHLLLESVLKLSSQPNGSVLRQSVSSFRSKSLLFDNSCSFYHTSVTNRALKKIPFEYVKSERIPAIYKSGDKEKLEIDRTKIMSKFVGSKELENADEYVRRMCSLQFATKSEIVSQIKEEYIDRVRKHPVDHNSLETRIAKLTAQIRNLQEHVKPRNRDSKGRVQLKHAIDRRHKYMKYMKRDDYERFVWIQKKLNVEYIEPLRYYYYETRKGTLRDMVQKYCDDIRVTRLQALKDKLKSQQEAFMKEKEEKLKFIASEEIALGISSEPTVTKDEMDLLTKKPPPIENTMLRIARTAEGKVVYSVPTWPSRPDDWP